MLVVVVVVRFAQIIWQMTPLLLLVLFQSILAKAHGTLLIHGLLLVLALQPLVMLLILLQMCMLLLLEPTRLPGLLQMVLVKMLKALQLTFMRDQMLPLA